MDTNAQTKIDPGAAGVSDLADSERHSNSNGCVPAAQSVAVIPGSIVKRICQIKQTVDAVKKSQRNQHGGYNFSSTDDVYAALTHKMGQVGLVLMSLEDSSEVVRLENKDGKTVQWLKVCYSFVWATETDTWTDPRARRTLFVQITGPQTFQAAQSFAEKAYLRSTFKLPSGDMDLDSMPQDEIDDEQSAPKTKRPSSYAKKGKNGKDPAAAKANEAAYNDLLAAIKAVANIYDLRSLWMEHAAEDGTEWADWPAAWAQILQDEYNLRLEQFQAMEAA